MAIRFKYKAGMLVRHRCGYITWICKTNGRLVLFGANDIYDLSWFRHGKYVGIFQDGLNYVYHELDIVEIYEYKYGKSIPFDMQKVLRMNEDRLNKLLETSYNLVHKSN